MNIKRVSKLVSIARNMEKLQIASLNVRGLQIKKRNRIFLYFKTKKFDAILLQETYSTPEDENGMGRPHLFVFSEQPQMRSNDTLYEQ